MIVHRYERGSIEIAIKQTGVSNIVIKRCLVYYIAVGYRSVLRSFVKVRLVRFGCRYFIRISQTSCY